MRHLFTCLCLAGLTTCLTAMTVYEDQVVIIRREAPPVVIAYGDATGYRHAVMVTTVQPVRRPEVVAIAEPVATIPSHGCHPVYQPTYQPVYQPQIVVQPRPDWRSAARCPVYHRPVSSGIGWYPSPHYDSCYRPIVGIGVHLPFFHLRLGL